jgi:hypothetical protein
MPFGSSCQVCYIEWGFPPLAHFWHVQYSPMSRLNMIFWFLLFFIKVSCAGHASSAAYASSKSLCVVQPSSAGGDDAPAIVAAFHKCGQNGKVIFTNHTYHINSVMNTTGLSNCHIELHGTLLVRAAIHFQSLVRSKIVSSNS